MFVDQYFRRLAPKRPDLALVVYDIGWEPGCSPRSVRTLGGMFHEQDVTCIPILYPVATIVPSLIIEELAPTVAYISEGGSVTAFRKGCGSRRWKVTFLIQGG